MIGACLLGGVWTASADDAAAPALGESLRAELTPSRPLYSPERPIWLRFTLHNISDEPVTIPLRYAGQTKDGIALSAELAFGTPGLPCLAIAAEDQKPTEIAPPEPANAAAGNDVLRIAPHGSIGAEFDLREVYQNVRYPGVYHCEWRPLDGQLGVVTASFRVEPRKDAIMVTDLGKITFVLDYDLAPKNVSNFVGLVTDGFYDGKTLHRVVPGFIIQGGCPLGNGKGIRPDGKLIPAEFSDTPIEAGTLAMARKPNDPDSASCQFFIALTRLPELDGRYTVIGQARDEESLRTLQQLAQVPTDAQGRPSKDLVIRSINLVDTEGDRVRHLGLRTIQAPPAPTPTTAESAAAPK